MVTKSLPEGGKHMKKILALLLALSMVFMLAACGGGKSGQKETVTVTFDTDGGEAMEAQTIEKGSALVRPATPKKTGYIFDKWTLNGQEYEFGTAVNENIVLKATWVDPNAGGGGESQSGPLFTAKTLVELHIRKGPGTDYEIAGKLPAGSTIEIFETKEAGGYTWNRINDTEWVADDGTWLDKTPAGGGSGSGGGSSSSSDAHPTELYFVNNWYWVQEKCYGDPEWVVKPESLKDKVTFTSSDTSIATVDSKGIVYGVKPGNVTITMKCGDMTDTLPLEVRSGQPYISLDKDYIHVDFTPENVHYTYAHTFTVSFHNGADPNSKVTYSFVRESDGQEFITGDTFYYEHVGRYIYTATTAEGYKASCTIDITGTELYAMTGAVVLSHSQGKPSSFYLVEDAYYLNGYSKHEIITAQCTCISNPEVSFTIYDNENADLSTTQPSTYHYFKFYDPLNDVYSIEYEWYF